MLDHPPGEPGMCARESWQALGGDQTPPNPPAWGTPNANAVYNEIIESGRYWTSTPIPRGAFIAWKYGNNGHAALSYGDGKIVTTDPTNDPGGTGIEPLAYPERWGATSSKRVWTDTYNGVRFDIEGATDHGPVYLSKLHYGQQASDSVKRLQLHLNGHPLQNGEELAISGNYLDQTDEEVRLCQQQHGYGNDPAKASSVGPKQAAHLFAGCSCTITDDTEPEAPPAQSGDDATVWTSYSGKPSGTLTISNAQDYVSLDFVADDPPTSGLEFHLLYVNCELTWSGSDTMGILRVKYRRDDGDETAFQDYAVPKGAALGSPDTFLLTATHWESGEKGKGGRWYLRCEGGIGSVKLGTRYCKAAVIS